MQLSIQFIDHCERNFVAMTTLLVSYLVAISILTITPGLDTTLIIRTATLEGKSSAFHAAIGISTGCIVWGLVVACGLGALFMASTMAFSVLKWVGAAYLAWLGLNMLFKPRHHLGQMSSNIPPSFALHKNAFFKGFLSFFFASVYSRRSRCIFMAYGAGDVACFDRYHLVNAVDLGNATYFSLFKTTQICARFRSCYGQYLPDICPQTRFE